MTLDEPFTLIMEGPIDNGDGAKRTPARRLACTCIIRVDSGDATPIFTPIAINDAKSGLPLDDEQDIPAFHLIIEAAKLLEWSDNHRDVFDNGKVVNLGWAEDMPATD